MLNSIIYRVMKKMWIVLLILWNAGYGQNSFSFTDTLFEFHKTTNFGIVHWYLEIFNPDNVDTTLRWKVHFSDSFPSEWVINFEDQTANHTNVLDGDSADFVLKPDLDFPQKLVIGCDHNEVASKGDTVRFDIYHPENPEAFESIYFVFFIEEGQPFGLSPPRGKKLNVYPNPFHNTLEVKGTDQLELYDSFGKHVRTYHSTGPIHHLDLHKLKKGVYYLRSGSVIEKLIKAY